MAPGLAAPSLTTVVSLSLEGTYTKPTLNQIGKVFVKLIQSEARTDFAKRQVGVEDKAKLINSFSYQTTGRDTIEILSDWPWVERIIEGRRPARMKWLNRKSGIKVVPLVEKGTGRIIFRAPPLTTASAWIHPAIAKHTFLERALDKLFNTIVAYFIEGQKDLIVNELIGAFSMKAEEA